MRPDKHTCGYIPDGCQDTCPAYTRAQLLSPWSSARRLSRSPAAHRLSAEQQLGSLCSSPQAALSPFSPPAIFAQTTVPLGFDCSRCPATSTLCSQHRAGWVSSVLGRCGCNLRDGCNTSTVYSDYRTLCPYRRRDFYPWMLSPTIQLRCGAHCSCSSTHQSALDQMSCLHPPNLTHTSPSKQLFPVPLFTHNLFACTVRVCITEYRIVTRSRKPARARTRATERARETKCARGRECVASGRARARRRHRAPFPWLPLQLGGVGHPLSALVVSLALSIPQSVF